MMQDKGNIEEPAWRHPMVWGLLQTYYNEIPLCCIAVVAQFLMLDGVVLLSLSSMLLLLSCCCYLIPHPKLPPLCLPSSVRIVRATTVPIASSLWNVACLYSITTPLFGSKY